MPGATEGARSRLSAEDRTALFSVIVCLLGIGGLLVGGVSLAVHHAIKGPESKYQVAFSTVGEACGGSRESGKPDSGVKGLVLDREKGELLYCGLVPGVGGTPAGSGGAFTGEETARVTKLAISLAAEGGLSDGEEDAVERLAEKIGRKHGYEPPSLAERATGVAGWYGLGAGAVLLVGLGLWGHYTGEA